MIRGRIEVKGLDQVVKDAQAAGAVGADRLVRAALVNSQTRVQTLARSKARHRTGTLQRSILPVSPMPYPSAEVEVNESYGVIIEEGSRPHDIVPKNKKALFWKGARHPVRKVHHPGTKPYPFFWPAVEQAQSYINQQFDTVITRLVNALSGDRSK